MKKNVLEIKNLSFEYETPKGKTRALEDISFSIRKGELISIVGSSGCGKSTLLGCVGGLLKSWNGQILLKGKQVSGPSKDCAMVFQNHSLFPWRTVLDNVTYGLELAGVNKKKREKLGMELIKLVGLEGFESFYPYQLSGGMQQRGNLARAWVLNPEVLLLDEPFASLDAQTRELMQAELLKIWQKDKKTVLFITHQINEAVYLSDRVIVLSKRPGKVKEIIDIDLPRPRNLDIKLTGKFIKIEKHIWKLIMEEVD